jgi:hypothetical protein
MGITELNSHTNPLGPVQTKCNWTQYSSSFGGKSEADFHAGVLMCRKIKEL